MLTVYLRGESLVQFIGVGDKIRVVTCFILTL